MNPVSLWNPKVDDRKPFAMAIGDDDRGPEMFDVTLSLLVAATVTVAMRCYVRIFMLKTFRIEDWLALATLVGCPLPHLH